MLAFLAVVAALYCIAHSADGFSLRSSYASRHCRPCSLYIGRAAAVRANTKAKTVGAKAKLNARYGKKIVMAVKAGGAQDLRFRSAAASLSSLASPFRCRFSLHLSAADSFPLSALPLPSLSLLTSHFLSAAACLSSLPFSILARFYFPLRCRFSLRSSTASRPCRPCSLYMGRAAAVRTNTKAKTDGAKAKLDARYGKKIVMAVKAAVRKICVSALRLLLSPH
jgi:hypothetical protein